MKTVNVDKVKDTAGIIASCDMIITVDSLAVHIAGAMQKRGLLLLEFHWDDYKWGLDETECSLYPSFDIARQEKIGDWTVPVISAADYIYSNLKV